jgi:1-acyl-sn-glycerol-3-phosphate acyltransferase
VFRLALATRVPIVPLAISGNERMPPRGTIRLYPGVVRIHRLPALTWDDYKDLSPFQLKNRVRDRIAAELVRMEGPP